MIRLILSGMLLIPTPDAPKPIPEPILVKAPESEKVEFKVVPSKYEIEQKKREQKRLKYENNFQPGTLTAYCNCKDTMNGETGITASGYPLDNGLTYKGYRILAADRSIPLGTLIDIRLSSGLILHGIVLDRGGAIHGSHFDIVGFSRKSAMKFGRQGMEWQRVGKLNLDS
jgi:3D (Asp-Asp-Asp) domain-containing protein